MAGVLQHLRSSTLNKRPNPASMVDGQIAINYASGSPGAFFKDSNGNLVKVGPVHVGATAPNASPASGGTAGNSLGEQWLDTSGGTYVFKIWDGAAWRSEAGEFVNVTGDTMTGSLTMGPSANLIFEGSTDDGFETTLTVVDPTADRTITLPNISGTVVTTGDSGTVTSTMITDGTIVNADVNASAAIAGTKISPDFGSQNVVTTGTATAASFIPSSSSVPSNGLYLPSANSVAISSNSTGRLFVDSSGQVGIGTSSPQSAVDVLSGVRGVPETSGSTTSVTTLRLRGSSNGVLDIGELSSATAGSYWLQVRDRTDLGYAYNLALQPNGGNVGIGTNAIRGTSLLDARGDISFGSNADYYGLLSYNAGTGHFESTSSDGAFKWIRASGAATSMVLDSSGRLLVGTSSSKTVGAGQYSLLNVQGYVGASNGGGDVTLSRGETAANITTGEVLGLISFTDSAGYAFAQFYCEADEAAGTNDYPGRLVFATTPENQTPSTGPVERMRISQNGLVSIFGPGGGTFLNLFNSGGYSGLHELDNTAYTIGQNSDVRAMRIGSGANWLTTGVNLAPGGTSWGTYSDERLKNDIVELTDCLDNIKGIRCVSYRLTDVDNANSKKRIGVIAQDLVGKYDEAINASRRSENDETEYLSVQYSDLIPVLLKALQEASVKIESLESRLTAAGI